MPRRKGETLEERQNRGYDEVVKGGPLASNSYVETDEVPPIPPDERPAQEMDDIDTQEADRARMDVRRHEHSAD